MPSNSRWVNWAVRSGGESGDPSRGRGSSTPSQGAWAVMGLLSHLSAEDTAIQRGVRWLLERQSKAGEFSGSLTWRETAYTGTGFPKHFYFAYVVASPVRYMKIFGQTCNLCAGLQIWAVITRLAHVSCQHRNFQTSLPHLDVPYC